MRLTLLNVHLLFDRKDRYSFIRANVECVCSIGEDSRVIFIKSSIGTDEQFGPRPEQISVYFIMFQSHAERGKKYLVECFTLMYKLPPPTLDKE